MKYKLLVSFLCVSLSASAQVVMTYESHGLSHGTENRMQQTDYVTPGEGGLQAVWDFSESIPVKDAGVVSETLTALDGEHILITGATGAKFSYSCNRTANVYEKYQDDSRTLIYDLPIRKIVYPFTYGSRIAGNFDARCIYKDSNIESKMAGSYSSEADGSGTLILPTGQILTNVLRVKTIEKYVEERCSNVEVETVKYLWYIAEHRYPVLVTWDINYTYPDGRTSTSQSSFYTLDELHQPTDTPVYTTYTAEEQGEITKDESVNHQVYPNPYNSYFHLTYILNKPTLVNIGLYSLSGNLISRIVDGRTQEGVQHITYNAVNELTGVYYLRLQFDDKLYVRALVKE